MKTVTLNNGLKMPILGLGVYQIRDEKECELVVSQAIETGYRLIDTAAAYMNEVAVGKGIKNSGVDRKDIFVTTKLWVQDGGYEKTLKAFDNSLSRLGLEYLDLYLIHQPYGDIFGSWKAMQQIYKSGKVKAIGVSNFHPDRIADLVLNSGFVPAVNQIETHPFFQQTSTQEFLKSYDIQLESWGPFAEGRNNIFENEILVSISKKYNKSVAQIILNWLIDREIVVIPKTVKLERMKENFDVFDFELSADDKNLIAGLETHQTMFDHRDPERVKMISQVKLDI